MNDLKPVFEKSPVSSYIFHIESTSTLMEKVQIEYLQSAAKDLLFPSVFSSVLLL